MTGIELIAQERQRIDAEGLDAKYISLCREAELVRAAMCHAIGYENFQHERQIKKDMPIAWPFWLSEKFWRDVDHEDRVAELVRAGAFIAAEVDRLQAMEGKENE